MDKRENRSTTLDEVRGRVHHRLQELSTGQRIEPLRDLRNLFIRELNYDYENQRLPLTDEKSTRLVVEEPLAYYRYGRQW